MRIVKVGKYVYENVTDNVIQPQLPTTQTELAQIVADTMHYLAKQRLQKILDQYGYNSLGDVQLYASQNDPEAQAILQFYTNANSNGYDDLLWAYIDSLATMTVDQLMNELQDLVAVEKNIYQQALQNNPLP